MKKLNDNEKKLVIIVLGVCALFFINLLFSKLSEKFSSIEKSSNRSELVIRKYWELEKNRGKILDEYKKIEKYTNLKGSDNEKIAAVLGRVEKEARKAGLIVIDMKPETLPKIKSSNTLVYRIQFNAEGDVAKLMDFLYGINNADVFLNVEKMNVSLKNEKTGLIRIESIIIGISLS